jgi:large subunit ribosomal protein L4
MAAETKTVSRDLNKVAKAVLTADEVGFTASFDEASLSQFSQYIRALYQNWRQGTLGVKGRSDVALSGKKPWKQKGTGRARAGTARSPLWRKGGVIFGPQPRTREHMVTKKTRKLVLGQLLNQLFENKGVYAFDWQAANETPKTKEMVAMIRQHQLENKNVLLLVQPGDIMTQRAAGNIANVRMAYFDQVNAFDLAHAQGLVVLKKDLAALKETVAKWN